MNAMFLHLPISTDQAACSSPVHLLPDARTMRPASSSILHAATRDRSISGHDILDQHSRSPETNVTGLWLTLPSVMSRRQSTRSSHRSPSLSASLYFRSNFPLPPSSSSRMDMAESTILTTASFSWPCFLEYVVNVVIRVGKC